MKKSLLGMLAAVLAGTVVSCSKDSKPEGQEETAGGSLTTKVVFEEAAGTKAAALSTAIPTTSWANIKQVQVFLYDASGAVKYSDVMTPSAGSTTFTWTDVPAGTYTVAMVANVKSTTDNVTTYLDGGTTPSAWTKFNVRSKSVNTQLLVGHKSSAFPASYPTAGLAGKSAFAEPAEIFTGYASGVTVTTGQTTNLSSSPIALKREVALMRVRVKTNDQTDADNTNIQFNQADASILIHRLPDGMKIGQGNAGGVEPTSNNNHIMVAASGVNTFSSANPASGYGPGTIIDADYTLWRDVVVFPNDAGRTNTSSTVQAANDRQYFIVVSGHAPQGHVLADGTTVTLPAGQTVYWSGLIRDAFVPNVIREVNLSLRSGGTTEPPVEPTQEGGLTIVVSAPAEWNSNIERTDIEL